jgi:hypothetical protein
MKEVAVPAFVPAISAAKNADEWNESREGRCPRS